MPWTETEERRVLARDMRDSDFIRMPDASMKDVRPPYSVVVMGLVVVDRAFLK